MQYLYYISPPILHMISDGSSFHEDRNVWYILTLHSSLASVSKLHNKHPRKQVSFHSSAFNFSQQEWKKKKKEYFSNNVHVL